MNRSGVVWLTVLAGTLANIVSLSTHQRTPRASQIVAAARELLEQDGPEGLTMRRLADRLGIRAPSLYKHFPDKSAVEAAVISDGFAELAGTFERATAGASDPLLSLAAAYREFARTQPHLYRLMTERPLPRRALVPGIEDRAALPLHEALGGDADLARAVWAFAHGMVNLELNGRFPEDADLDAAWRRGLAAFGDRNAARRR
jgi:AcrR family transcriptional regulator